MLKELVLGTMMSLTPTASADTVPTQKQFMIDEAFCLAQNVYFEARNQPLAGQMAVISVTVNRVNDNRFPNSICGVVYEGPHRPSWKDNTVMIPVKNRCQFSWYCDGKSDKPDDEYAWAYAQMVAADVLRGEVPEFTGGSTHSHAYYVNPYWADKMLYQGDFGSHYFFREIDGLNR